MICWRVSESSIYCRLVNKMELDVAQAFFWGGGGQKVLFNMDTVVDACCCVADVRSSFANHAVESLRT